MKELQECILKVRKLVNKSFSLRTNLLENFLHLGLIICAELLPGFEDYWLEIVINIIGRRR
jgi:hypothetical protein